MLSFDGNMELTNFIIKVQRTIINGIIEVLGI